MEKNRVQELIDHILGTCKGLGSACDELGFDSDDLTDEELQELDSEVFECTSCGWWYEVGEEGHSPDGDRWCQDCCESEEE